MLPWMKDMYMSLGFVTDWSLTLSDIGILSFDFALKVCKSYIYMKLGLVTDLILFLLACIGILWFDCAFEYKYELKTW